MVANRKQQSMLVTTLLNATLFSIKNIIPLESNFNKPERLKDYPSIDQGIQIGLTGDIKGALIFNSDNETFSSIGEEMYGITLNEDMLQSFSGELSNMIAGGITTYLAKYNTNINITTPIFLQRAPEILTYKDVLKLLIRFKQNGELNTYLLLK